MNGDGEGGGGGSDGDGGVGGPAHNHDIGCVICQGTTQEFTEPVMLPCNHCFGK